MPSTRSRWSSPAAQPKSAKPPQRPPCASCTRKQTSSRPTAISLGYLRPDTSIVETEVEVFLLEVASIDAVRVDEETEGIAAYRMLTRAELAAAIRDHTIRDGFTLGAFALLSASEIK